MKLLLIGSGGCEHLIKPNSKGFPLTAPFMGVIETASIPNRFQRF